MGIEDVTVVVEPGFELVLLPLEVDEVGVGEAVEVEGALEKKFVVGALPVDPNVVELPLGPVPFLKQASCTEASMVGATVVGSFFQSARSVQRCVAHG